MIRYVLATVLAVALLGASVPAVHDVAEERTASRLSQFGVDLDRGAAKLRTESDPIGPDAEGGRFPVTLTIPQASLTAAHVRFAKLCSSSEGRPTLHYAVGNRPPTSYRLLESIRVRGTSIRFTEPGTHVVELRFYSLDRGDIVVASTPESSNTETEPSAACDFSSDSEPTTSGGAGANRPFGPRRAPPTL